MSLIFPVNPLFARGGKASVEYVDFAKQSNTSTGSSLIIAKPTGTLENDIMVAIMCSSNAIGASWTGDTGWTETADINTGGTGIRVAYKVAGASEGANYTFTFSSALTTLSGVILTYRNGAWDTVTAANIVFESPNKWLANSINLASSGSVLLTVFTQTPANITYSSPSGGLSQVTTDSDATQPSFGAFHQLEMDAGATGSRTVVPSAQGGNGCSAMIGIQPA